MDICGRVGQVGLCIVHDCEPCKTDEPIDDPFRMWTRGRKIPRVRWVPDPPPNTFGWPWAA